MSEKKIQLIINADGADAINGINKVTGSINKMEADTRGFVEKIKAHWLGISASVYASAATIQKAWDLAQKATGYAEQKASLNALAAQYGRTADSIVSDIQRASNGLISLQAIAETAGTALARGLNPDQITKMAEAAEILSNVSGRKVVDIFNDMTEAIAKNKEKALEQEVGVINLAERYGDFAKGMTETQEQAARYQIVMERVEGIQARLGASTDSVSDKMERFTVQIEDLKLKLGELVVRAAAGFMAVVDGFIMAVNSLAADIIRPFAWVEEQLNKVGLGSTVWQKMLTDQKALVDYYENSAKENFSLMIAQTDQLMGVKGKGVKKELKKEVKDITNFGKSPATVPVSSTTSLSDYQPFHTLTGFYPTFENIDLTEPIKEIKPTVHEAKEQLSLLQVAAQETALSLKWSFMGFFDYTSDQFMKFGELAKNVLNDILMKIIEMKVVNPMVQASATGLEGLYGYLGFHQGGQVLHQGGQVEYYVPRFHGGGLRGDERMTINKVGERYITEEQNAWLTKQANAGNGGGDIKVNIQMQNKTGLPLGIRQTGQKVDEKTKVKTLILELAYSDIEFINGLKGAMAR